MDRKKFFRDGIPDLFRGLWKSPVGQILDRQLSGFSNLLAPQGLDQGMTTAPLRPRPPGALEDPEEFDQACTRCGDCASACPYGSIFAAEDSGGPFLDPNHVACHLCEDFPCIAACNDEALLPLNEGELPGFGRAQVVRSLCVNHIFNRDQRPRDRAGRVRNCRECERACPVADVISYDAEKIPVIGDMCTGCGLCVAVCPAEPIALHVSDENS